MFVYYNSPLVQIYVLFSNFNYLGVKLMDVFTLLFCI